MNLSIDKYEKIDLELPENHPLVYQLILSGVGTSIECDEMIEKLEASTFDLLKNNLGE